MKFKHSRYLYFCAVLVAVLGCDSENSSDCFQAAGSIIQITVPTEAFTQIQIEGEVTLIVEQGPIQEVKIESGENLLNDVEVVVAGEILIIKDTNSCNFVRDYGITVATVITPDLKKILNASSYDVIGRGRLVFPELILQSNTSVVVESPRKGGDFYMNLACEELSVFANGQSVFFLSGDVNLGLFRFDDENPRLEGRHLRVNKLNVFSRSANKMIVNPLQEIRGEILGTGDIISVNRPPLVDVQELFTGKLIFE
jgi:hypothetical protein